jgi:hypothetical protein
VNDEERRRADRCGLDEDLGRALVIELDLLSHEHGAEPTEAAELGVDVPHQAIAVDDASVGLPVSQPWSEEVPILCEIPALERGPRPSVHLVKFSRHLRGVVHNIAGVEIEPTDAKAQQAAEVSDDSMKIAVAGRVRGRARFGGFLSQVFLATIFVTGPTKLPIVLFHTQMATLCLGQRLEKTVIACL